MSNADRRRFRVAHSTRSLALLLVIVILLQFGYPITLCGEWWTALYMLLYVGMVFYGTAVTREASERGNLIVPLGVIFLGLAVWFTIDQKSRAATLSMLIAVSVFMLALLITLGRFVFRRRNAVSLDLILSAVSTYLIIGGFFGALSGVLEILHPGSYADPATPGVSPQWQQMVYFSFVTLATLGYGDIVPVAPWARSLASFETVLGTLFLAIVISRLVGIWSSTHAARDDD
ncbi:potassium channel family protein [Nocardia crassostreae]|uniref:potassium channel family protein n=1 Tax=Nocardia crassostreae TaxID=53428 RepID=UPI0009FD7302|nr:potassium channel family protein [Nocardia crassostreae]